MKFVRFAGAAVAALAIGSAAVPAGAVVITDSTGDFSAGIGANGELHDNDTNVGLRRNADGYDPIRPDTPRDSWGLNAAYADQNFFGTGGIVSTDIVAGPNGAVATTLTEDGFEVIQRYSFVAPNILKIDTSVTNLTGGSLNAIFQRNVDWDMFPASFENNTFGPIGGASNVDSSYFGFEDPTGSASYGFSCGSGCNEFGDLGAGIRVDLGAIGAGRTSRFNYFYGVSREGEDATALIGQTQAAGATYLLAGQSIEENPGSLAATLGVGGIPEPSGWAMMILGFFGLGFALRRPRAVTA